METIAAFLGGFCIGFLIKVLSEWIDKRRSSPRHDRIRRKYFSLLMLLIPTVLFSQGEQRVYSEWNIKVLLDGCYNDSGKMSTALATSHLLPTRLSNDHSYGALFPRQKKWLDCSKPEVVYNDSTVDFVQVQLRPSLSCYPGELYTEWGMLTKSGRIRGLDGGFLKVGGVNWGSWHIVVIHRTHLPIITRLPIEIQSNRIQEVDLTDVHNVYYTTKAMKQQRDGRWTMWAGDFAGGIQGMEGRGDGVIDLAEWSQLDNFSDTSGYFAQDANMDGLVDVKDSILVMENLEHETYVPFVNYNTLQMKTIFETKYNLDIGETFINHQGCGIAVELSFNRDIKLAAYQLKIAFNKTYTRIWVEEPGNYNIIPTTFGFTVYHIASEPVEFFENEYRRLLTIHIEYTGFELPAVEWRPGTKLFVLDDENNIQEVTNENFHTYGRSKQIED